MDGDSVHQWVPESNILQGNTPLAPSWQQDRCGSKRPVSGPLVDAARTPKPLAAARREFAEETGPVEVPIFEATPSKWNGHRHPAVARGSRGQPRSR